MKRIYSNLRRLAQKVSILSMLLIAGTVATSGDANAVYFGLKDHLVSVSQSFNEKRSICIVFGAFGCTPVESMFQSNYLYSIRPFIGHDFYKSSSSRTSLEIGYYIPLNGKPSRFIDAATWSTSSLYTWHKLHMVDLSLVHHQNLLNDSDLFSVFGKAGLLHSRLSSNSRYSENNQIVIDSLSGVTPLIGAGLEIKPWKHFSIDLNVYKQLQKLNKNTDKTSIELDNNLHFGLGMTFHF